MRNVVWIAVCGCWWNVGVILICGVWCVNESSVGVVWEKPRFIGVLCFLEVVMAVAGSQQEDIW
jgi:hypothetical protein